MRILLDTSTLVAAMVKTHAAHSIAVPWLQKAKTKSFEGLVAAHSIAELYAILTTLPVRPPISPQVAREAIQHDVLGTLEVVSLTQEDYAAVIEHSVELGIIGGATYDALILRAAIQANADPIVTLNSSDFTRIYPELADKIISP